MVFKDALGSKQAQLQLAEHEKQLLLSLKKNNHTKKKQPEYDALGGPVPVVPKYKPSDMHCLKKLLEQDFPVDQCLTHDNPDASKCECMIFQHPDMLETAVTKYIQDQYLKYLLRKKQQKAELMAQLEAEKENEEDESESDSDSDIGSTSSDDDDEDEDEDEPEGPKIPQININII